MLSSPSVVLVGPVGVGKTSLAQSLSKLSRDLKATCCPECFALCRGTTVVLLWDTPGFSRFSSVSSALLGSASLLLSCSSCGSYCELPKEAKAKTLRVRTKDDLGEPWFPADLACSSLTGSGVGCLFDAIFSILEQPPVVSSGCCHGSLTAELTHSTVEQYRLSLLFKDS